MFHLLALLACASDPEPGDSDTQDTHDTGLQEDQVPVVRIEGEILLFGQDQAIQVSGTATDRQTPNQLQAVWVSDVDGVVGESTPSAGLVSLRAPELSLGWHVLTLSVTDPDGNVGQDTVELKRNTRPEPPQISISPEQATHNQDLVVRIDGPGFDADGDELYLQISWFKDGEEQPFQGETIPADSLSGGETWEVRVASVDEVEAGEPAVLSTQIQNNPPGSPVVALAPERIGAGAEPVVCTIQTPAVDVDGQSLTYNIYWTADGLTYPDSYPEALGPQDGDWVADTVPAEDTALALQWSCEARAHDGYLEGVGSSAWASTVAFEIYGLDTIDSNSGTVQKGTIITVPVRIKQAGTLFGITLNTLTDNGSVRMALYSNESDRPWDLLAQATEQKLVVGENRLLFKEPLEVSDESYFMAFHFSDSETVSYKTGAFKDSGYYALNYSLGWPTLFSSEPTVLEGYLFNLWVLVK